MFTLPIVILIHLLSYRDFYDRLNKIQLKKRVFKENFYA